MKRTYSKVVLLTIIAELLPEFLKAQDFTGDISSFQSVLDNLYDEMIPLCGQLISVGRGLAGFAALWYIASRIWRHIANAEPVDFYPLLRPFAIGMAIMFFPSVLSLVNAVLNPTVTGTAAMVSGSNNAIAYLLKKKGEAIMKTPAWQMYVGTDGDGDRDKWYQYTHPDNPDEGVVDGLGNDVQFAMSKAYYNFRNAIKQWMSEILHILYEAAALCINTIRTFYLIVLAILGPLVFGLSVFDGLQQSLTIWLARYINVFLWLPVANIFGSIIGKIQENMLKIDIQQVNQYGDTFFSSSDTAYLVFMVIGIVGYFTVPSVANYIVHAGGQNSLLSKVTSLSVFSGQQTYSATSGSLSYLSGLFTSGSQENQSASAKRTSTKPDNYLTDKLKGN